MKTIAVFREIVADLPTKITAEYFCEVLVLLFVLGTPWYFLRRKIQKDKHRILCDALVVALVVAPSVFSMDMGSATVPALVVILLALLGASNLYVLICSVFLIVITWLLVLLLLSGLTQRWSQRR